MSEGIEREKTRIIPIEIVDEMKRAYIDYSMSVIISRAIPDVRDGLKPVQRRILFCMNNLGLTHNKPHRKSVKVVGEVMGDYHPHGNEAIYLAMVHMAQPWSLRYPLVDGQGNFGSVDGDGPAAMRYTESRMKKLAEEMLFDIDKNTVDLQPNFDESKKEPVVLPSKFPNLLINGTSGIAVGMATNMPPHNINEIVDGIVAYVDNPDISTEELMHYISGPDFPTGGIICGIKGIIDAYATGRGRIIVRAKAEIDEPEHGKTQIIITEIPFMVNKAMLVEKIADLVNGKRIDGIADIRDESDKEGLRIAIDLKKEAIPQVVLNNLFANTAMQSSFNVNNVCLVHGRPMTLGLKDLIKYFYEHRHEVVVRRTKFDLTQTENRLHILDGYIIALDNIDAIIQLIKSSQDSITAITRMNAEFGLTEIQAKAILDMKLHRLTGLEREKINKEHAELEQLAERLRAILADDELVKCIIKDELIDIKNRCGDSRKTKIEQEVNRLTIKDIIPDSDVVITLSNQGYIKRTLLSEYKLQNRGGVGAKGSSTKEGDFIKYLTVSSIHKFLLAFTAQGELYWKNVYDLPEGSKQSKGRSIQNVFPIANDDKLVTMLSVDDLKNDTYLTSHYVIFCTKKGIIKKTDLKAYSNPRVNGIHAIGIRDDDELISVKLTDGTMDIIIAVKSGKAIRFHESTVRPMGRTATGVKGIELDKCDVVVGMVTINDPNKNLLVVSEKGFGKTSTVNDYRITNRGGKGIKTINVTSKTGTLVGLEDVCNDDELMIINNEGVAIRILVKDIRKTGRNAQGVTLVKLHGSDFITSITKLCKLN